MLFESHPEALDATVILSDLNNGLIGTLGANLIRFNKI